MVKSSFVKRYGAKSPKAKSPKAPSTKSGKSAPTNSTNSTNPTNPTNGTNSTNPTNPTNNTNSTNPTNITSYLNEIYLTEADPSTPSPLHRLLSWLGIISLDSDQVWVPFEVVEEVPPLELEGEGDITKCEVPEQSDIPATWHYYDGLIEKNRKIASIASSIKEYAPKRGLVEDITEQQDEKDSDGKDVSNKDVDQH
eukprot:scaffold2892_cov118-Skeletonema_menzelii.AAC.3